MQGPIVNLILDINRKILLQGSLFETHKIAVL
jgi:hypothetical protein